MAEGTTETESPTPWSKQLHDAIPTVPKPFGRAGRDQTELIRKSEPKMATRKKDVVTGAARGKRPPPRRPPENEK